MMMMMMMTMTMTMTMMCKRPAQVPMLCVLIYNMKLATMQKTTMSTMFSAHTKMTTEKRGQEEVFGRNITVHCNALHCVTSHCVTLQCDNTWHYIAKQHIALALHLTTLPCILLHTSTLITSHHIKVG